MHLNDVRWPSVTSGCVAARREAHVELSRPAHHGKPEPQCRGDARWVTIPCHPRNVDRVGTRHGVNPSAWGLEQSSPSSSAEGPIGHARAPHTAPMGHPAGRPEVLHGVHAAKSRHPAWLACGVDVICGRTAPAAPVAQVAGLRAPFVTRRQRYSPWPAPTSPLAEAASGRRRPSRARRSRVRGYVVTHWRTSEGPAGTW